MVDYQLGIVIDEEVSSKKFFHEVKDSEQWFIFCLIISFFESELKGIT